MNNWAITTSKARGKHNLGLTDYAQTLADQLKIPVIARDNKGIGKLIHQYSLDVLLVEEDDGLVAHWQDGQVFTYHPGMAVPRIKHIKDGDSDMLIDAHPEPVEIGRAAEKTFEFFVRKAQLLIDPLPYGVLARNGQGHIDTVESHKVYLPLPTLLVPPTHRVVEGAVVEAVAILVGCCFDHPLGGQG